MYQSNIYFLLGLDIDYFTVSRVQWIVLVRKKGVFPFFVFFVFLCDLTI
jgi:hypothetical protein